MPVAATTRSIPVAPSRPWPLAAAWTSLVAFVVLLVETMREAKAAERAAHQQYPFIEW